jgi:2-polyprenyl-6-methoxyphenol hydroxylase-like FAD-dependent oxidoreductase
MKPAMSTSHPKTRMQVAIVGAGPAGLATAIHLAGQGLSVTVIERAPAAPDKACGEGIMPSGVRALESLGVLERIDPQARAPIDAISWTDPAARS